MEVASQAPLSNPMDTSITMDLDIDLGPPPEIETVSLSRLPTKMKETDGAMFIGTQYSDGSRRHS